MPDNYEDVGLFHERFGLPTSFEPQPRAIDDEMLEFRTKFMEEELLEFKEGAAQGDHAQMFDALIDLVYVALGTAHLQGYPWQAGWALVQAANMSKTRAKADGSDSKRGSALDVVKPPGWTPPDIEGLLAELGFVNEPNRNSSWHCPGCHRDTRLTEVNCLKYSGSDPQKFWCAIHLQVLLAEALA